MTTRRNLKTSCYSRHNLSPLGCRRCLPYHKLILLWRWKRGYLYSFVPYNQGFKDFSLTHLFYWFGLWTGLFLSPFSSKKKHCVIYGKWTECMWSVDPQAYEGHKKAEKKGDSKKPKNVSNVFCRPFGLGFSLLFKPAMFNAYFYYFPSVFAIYDLGWTAGCSALTR